MLDSYFPVALAGTREHHIGGAGLQSLSSKKNIQENERRPWDSVASRHNKTSRIKDVLEGFLPRVLDLPALQAVRGSAIIAGIL